RCLRLSAQGISPRVRNRRAHIGHRAAARPAGAPDSRNRLAVASVHRRDAQRNCVVDLATGRRRQSPHVAAVPRWRFELSVAGTMESALRVVLLSYWFPRGMGYIVNMLPRYLAR